MISHAKRKQGTITDTCNVCSYVQKFLINLESQLYLLLIFKNIMNQSETKHNVNKNINNEKIKI